MAPYPDAQFANRRPPTSTQLRSIQWSTHTAAGPLPAPKYGTGGAICSILLAFRRRPNLRFQALELRPLDFRSRRGNGHNWPFPAGRTAVKELKWLRMTAP